MVAKVPVVDEPQVRNAPISGQKQQIDAPAAAFGAATAAAFQDTGSAIAKLGAQWETKAVNMQDETNELRALQLQTDIEQEMSNFLYDPNEGLLTKKGQNALYAPELTSKKLGEIKKKYDGVKENQAVREMLNKSLLQIDGRYKDLASRHAMTEYGTYKTQTLDSKIILNMQDIALNYMDDKEFQNKQAENFELLKSKAVTEGWDNATLEKEKLKLYSEGRTAQITQMISTDDPRNILIGKKVYEEARNRGQIGFDDSIKLENMLNTAVPKAAATVAYKTGRFAASATEQTDIINFIIDGIEGGDELAQEPDGAVAKFGINSKWNPDLDVPNLTREQAVDRYKKNYWNAYGIDEVPENMRLLAFDIAVNHKSDFAKRAIEKIKSGADADKIMNSRLAEYQRLAKADPAEYGRYYEGWKVRLQKIASQMSNTMPTDPETMQSAASTLDSQYPGAGAELLQLYDNDIKAKAEAKKQNKDALQDEINSYVSKSNGDYTVIPTVLRAKAKEAGIDITSFKGVSDPEVVYQLDALTSDEFAQLDLTAPEIVQNIAFDKLQEYRKKQGELQKPENKYFADQIDGVVNYYFRAQGTASAYDPENKANNAAVAQMKNYVTFKAEELRKKTANVTKADLTKFANEYVSLTKKSGVKSAANIPEAERKVIESSLLNMGMTPTNEAIMAVFLNARFAEK
jgi:hypothetical protein